MTKRRQPRHRPRSHSTARGQSKKKNEGATAAAGLPEQLPPLPALIVSDLEPARQVTNC